MGKKKLIVVGMGLVILIIAVGVAYQNYVDAKISREEVKSLQAVVQQKDITIVKLTKEIKAKQEELSGLRMELDNAKKALNETKTPIIKVTEQPIIPVSGTVNK